MRRRLLGTAVAACATLAATAPAAAAPTVTVRVEGQNATLLPPTTVTLGPDPVTLADATCSGNSAAAALDKATGGNWDRKAFTSTILGESHTFAASDYWAEWVSNRFGGGICNDQLAEGDELLMLVDTADASSNPTVFPLVLSGVPIRVAPGAPFTVTVTRFRTSGAAGTSTAEPAANVTVAGGGASATTGPGGKATVVLSALGPTSLRAVSASARSVFVPVCVTSGADGACGTTVPSPGAAPPAAKCVTTGDDGLCGTRDRRAPLGRILSIRNAQKFRRHHGPRLLRGEVSADPSGIAGIRLRLTRRHGGRCSTFHGRKGRFVRIRVCGAVHGRWFSIGTEAQWSFLLPNRLGPGRYVLDVQARDRAGNRDRSLVRGRSRVVFRVLRGS